MSPRICICCGESIPDGSQPLARNPNLCPACANVVDGHEDFRSEESDLTEDSAPRPVPSELQNGT